MKKNIIATAIVATSFISTPTLAQESENETTVYAGVNEGYHDLGAGDSALVVNDDGFIYGGYLGIAGANQINGVDDNVDDYLVGIGAQFQVSENVSIRAVVDTISFDITRATVGLQFNF